MMLHPFLLAARLQSRDGGRRRNFLAVSIYCGLAAAERSADPPLPVGILTVIELLAGISTRTRTAVRAASGTSYWARTTPLLAEG